MDAVQMINNNLARLPLPFQSEVLDFTEYLIFKNERESFKDSRDLSTLSLNLAMRGMEDEETPQYSREDLRETVAPTTCRMTTITLELPSEISLNFNNINEIRQTLYEDFIIEQRQSGNISLGRAAKLLGLTYSEFFNLLGKKGLSFINATPDELEDSYQHFEKIMEQVNQ